MIVKAFVFLLFSVAIIQANAVDNTAGQMCTKDDLLHAQGKSPCLLKLNSTRDLADHMGQQYVAFYKELRSHNLDESLVKQLDPKHMEFTKGLAALLKEYRTDIEKIKKTYRSGQRKELCQGYIASVETKQAHLNALVKDIQSQVIAARERSLQRAQPADKSWLEQAWGKIERPLFTAVGIGVVCHLTWKIGKGIYGWARTGFRFESLEADVAEGIDEASLAEAQADIDEFRSAVGELTSEEQLGANAQSVLGDLSGAMESNAELSQAAGESLANEVANTLAAFEARTAATEAIGTPAAEELLVAARTVEVARLASTAEALEATHAVGLAQTAQAARIAELAEGLGEAVVEPAGEVVGEVAVEVAGEVAAETAGEVALATIAEGSAVSGAAIAAPIAIAAVGVVAIGTGIAYVIDPEGTKQFYRNMWTSIKHLFHYY